jgi:hypothetical protein
VLQNIAPAFTTCSFCPGLSSTRPARHCTIADDMVAPAQPPPANSQSLTAGATTELSDEQDDSDEAFLILGEPLPRLGGSPATLEYGLKITSNQAGHTDAAGRRLLQKKKDDKKHGEWIKAFEVRSGAEKRVTGKHDCFDVIAKAWFDTGSTVNVVSPEFVDKLCAWAKTCGYVDGVEVLKIPASDREGLLTLTGQPLLLKNIVMLDIKPRDCRAGRILQPLANKVHWRVRFYVAQDPLRPDCDMIIGTNTMDECMDSEAVEDSTQMHVMVQRLKSEPVVDSAQSHVLQQSMKSEAVETSTQSYTIEQSLKNNRRKRRLIGRLKDFALRPFRKRNKLGYILVNEVVRPRAKGPEGFYSSHQTLLLY